MKFRYARHTDSIKKLTEFYTRVFGFEVLGSFESQDSYNGVFLGIPGKHWHLEFTESDTKANHTFDEDDILVFYPTDKKEYESTLNRITQYNIALIEPANSYWKENGIMVEDPDGYKVVLSFTKLKQHATH